MTIKTSAINEALALAQLKRALRHIDQAQVIFKSKTSAPGAMPPVGKLYEAWSMVHLAHEVVTDGPNSKHANIVWHLSDGSDATVKDPVIFRGSPARLNRTHRVDEPGYLSIDDGHSPVLEIHSSLQFVGWSGATHELDLAVTWHDAVEAWWEDPAEPEWTGVDYIAAFELKCHAKSTDVSLVRQAALTRVDLAARFRRISSGGQAPPVIAALPTQHGMVFAKRNALHVFVSVQPLTQSGTSISATYGLLTVTMSPDYLLTGPDLIKWKGALRWIDRRF